MNSTDIIEFEKKMYGSTPSYVDVKKVSKINELFDIISDAQDKAFDDIVKKTLKKD